MSHSPEPWTAGEYGINDASGQSVQGDTGYEKCDLSIDDRARIVACVNLLAGFATEDLTLLAGDRESRENARSSIEDAIMAAKGGCA